MKQNLQSNMQYSLLILNIELVFWKNNWRGYWGCWVGRLYMISRVVLLLWLPLPSPFWALWASHCSYTTILPEQIYTEFTNSPPLNKYSLFYFWMWGWHKEFHRSKKNLLSFRCTFSLHHKKKKNEKATSILAHAITRHVLPWLMLSCETDGLLWNFGGLLQLHFNFQEVQMWNEWNRNFYTVTEKKSFFFFNTSWKQLGLELSSFVCWSWWGHFHLLEQRKWNSLQCPCCLGSYSAEREHKIECLTDKQRKTTLSTCSFKDIFIYSHT